MSNPLNRKRNRSALAHILIDLEPGDSIHTRLHKTTIDRVLSELSDAGYSFSYEKSTTGYRLFCQSVPKGGNDE